MVELNLRSLRNLLAGIKIDPGLLHFYHMGVGVGLVILTTLVLFPGGTSPESKQDDNSEPISEKAALQSTKDPEHENTNTVSAERSFVAGRRSRRLSSKDAEQGWTPHKRLNFIVYIILMSGAFIVLDREYGGILTVWLRLHFPREAATLGFKVNRR